VHEIRSAKVRQRTDLLAWMRSHVKAAPVLRGKSPATRMEASRLRAHFQQEIPLLQVFGCIVASMILTTTVLAIANFIFDGLGLPR
jgi:hypothetical protein